MYIKLFDYNNMMHPLNFRYACISLLGTYWEKRHRNVLIIIYY